MFVIFCNILGGFYFDPGGPWGGFRNFLGKNQKIFLNKFSKLLYGLPGSKYFLLKKIVNVCDFKLASISAITAL